MSPQRYAAVNQQDHDDDEDNDRSPIALSSPPNRAQDVPVSPPPSFRSRTSSPSSRRLLQQDPLANDTDRDLADAFDDDDASDEENDGDDRQRLMRTDTSRSTSIAGNTSSQSQQPPAPPSSRADRLPIERRVTELPAFQPQRSTRVIPGVTAPKPAADGVFANLSAKPTAGETLEDKPPTYEQAAADATPPYWETTILAPGMNSDEVYINGLPVGSLFSFIWNGMISMSFLFPGFLLTYLLHTTHAAKNGSLAGLGLTLVQYGFYMRGGKDAANPDAANPGQFAGTPPDPNSHTFDPNNPTGEGSTGSGGSSAPDGLGSADFISYALMIIGWFILIRAVTAFLRARREEQLVLQSPARGLSQPVVAEGEGERAV